MSKELAKTHIEIVHNLLTLCAEDTKIAWNLANGAVHEDCLLTELKILLNEWDVPARMMNARISSHPLAERQTLPRPPGYLFVRKSFLEIDGHYFRIYNDRGPIREDDSAVIHATSPEHALSMMYSHAYSGWEEYEGDRNDFALEEWGRMLKGTPWRENMIAAYLQKTTPIQSTPRRVSRL